jgi:hypothetical protein
VRLPLFREEYVVPLCQGETFVFSRKLIQATCLKRLQLTRCKGPTRFIDELKTAPVRYEDANSETWHEMIDSIKPKPPTERLKTP